MLTVVTVQLYQLREVSCPANTSSTPLPVEVKAICRKLEAVLICDPAPQCVQELIGRFTVAFADRVRGNQF